MSKIALTEKVAVEIGGALQRLEELSGKTIIETADAAEKRGLEAFLAKTMTEHAQEFVGCWFTIRNQYRPLVQGFAAILQNASTILSKVNAETQTPDSGGKVAPTPEETRKGGVC
jgi:hypothetical protein